MPIWRGIASRLARRRPSIRSFAALSVLLAALAVPTAGGAASCAPTTTDGGQPWPGGEWRTYSHDSSNTRHQPLETTIGPDNVRSLTPAWVFAAPESVPEGADGGGFSNTPVIADGCTYLTSNTGWVFALNADTGELVWRTLLEGAGQALVGGAIVGSVAIENGVVYVGVSQPGEPYVAALNQATGAVLWRTIVEVGQENSFIDAAPVLYDGMIFQGFAGYEGNTEVSRGGFAILQAGAACESSSRTFCADPVPGAAGGRVLAHQYTVSDEEYAAGYRGASVWCTGAVDRDAGYVYACGGNPQSEGLEAKYANSLFKVDMNRGSPTFGTVVASYKGNVDQYYPGLDKQPICEKFKDETTVLVWSAGCLMLDLDFGASPNLFRDSSGRLIVGDLQKSGVYHAVYADDMTAAWNAPIAPPCFSCNATSGATDGRRVYTVGTPPSHLVSLGINDSPLHYKWVAPILDLIHYQSVSVANGVVYVIDNMGSLNAYDAETGVQLLKRPLMLDNGGESAFDPGSQGVSIARNTVYAASGQFVVAYRLGGGGVPGLPGLPQLPGLPAGVPVVAGPGSYGTTYLTPLVIVQADSPALTFLNADTAPHDVDHRPAPGQPSLFESPVIGTGQTVDVTFTGPLQAGQQYEFFCTLHPNMSGTILAQ